MRNRKQVEQISELIIENPNALAITVPTFALKILIQNCFESHAIRKQLAVEKARVNSYERQLRLIGETPWNKC